MVPFEESFCWQFNTWLHTNRNKIGFKPTTFCFKLETLCHWTAQLFDRFVANPLLSFVLFRRRLNCPSAKSSVFLFSVIFFFVVAEFFRLITKTSVSDCLSNFLSLSLCFSLSVSLSLSRPLLVSLSADHSFLWQFCIFYISLNFCTVRLCWSYFSTFSFCICHLFLLLRLYLSFFSSVLFTHSFFLSLFQFFWIFLSLSLSLSSPRCSRNLAALWAV